MSTAIAALGGIGLFLLGMAIMTDGLKGLAGSSLRNVLAKAAATPLSGAFWGGVVTLLVQSSSATTMTTIGLVSAGLLTFPQGLGLVFGANIGTTGTSWLVALIGVRISLAAYALPMIFVGALLKLVAKGRPAAAGAALAGFALVLYGLTTLQQGMGGIAERLHPEDLPVVLGAPGVGLALGVFGLLALVLAGLVMTAVMQSSTAAIAVTISAYYAGAIGLDQGCALIIGQNIGTATSSAMAAIGASVTAKRLAVAYCLFKLVAALIAVAAFPATNPLLLRWSADVGGATLLAAYHTAFNVIGVAVLMPLIDRFTQLVERLLPDRRSPLTRGLDPAALANPVVAVEAVRRTAALALGELAGAIAGHLSSGKPRDAPLAAPAAAALREARTFMSKVGPPGGDAEATRFVGTLRALDHAARLAEVADQPLALDLAHLAAEDARATELGVAAMHDVVLAIADIAKEAGLSDAAAPIDALATPRAARALTDLEAHANELSAFQQWQRPRTLAQAAAGDVSVDQAMARIDAVRRLDILVRHATRAAAHLLGGLAGAQESAAD